MQNTNTIKICIFKIVYFCVCDFLSIKSIFYTLHILFSYKTDMSIRVFKWTSLIATSSAFEL